MLRSSKVVSFSALFLTLFLPGVLTAGSRVIFFDDFNTNESFEEAFTPNATNKVYKTNSLPEGHLLKKWNYSWEYQYLEGDWKQAFYCVAPGESVMTQAGRSGTFRYEAPFRITANVEIPASAKSYRIEFKQFKNDNDPLYFVLGGDRNARDGTEIGYENQLPGTDTTVADAFLRGDICMGLIREGFAHHRKWVDVAISVDLETNYVTWTMDGKTMFTAYARDLKPGGYFGIYMRYERGTKFDDVKITITE